MKTVGLLRRGVAAAVDHSFAAGVVGLALAAGVLDATMLQPEAGWFWTEWWLKNWLDEPGMFTRPIIAWIAIAWLWISGWEVATGRSIGARVAGIEAVDGGGMLPSRGRLVACAAGRLLVIVTGGLTWLWIFVAPDRRAIHDVLSGLYVVRAS